MQAKNPTSEVSISTELNASDRLVAPFHSVFHGASFGTIPVSRLRTLQNSVSRIFPHSVREPIDSGLGVAPLGLTFDGDHFGTIPVSKMHTLKFVTLRNFPHSVREKRSMTQELWAL